MKTYTARGPRFFLLVAAACLVAAQANAADGTDDVLWFNSMTGDVSVWYMADAALALEVLVGSVEPGVAWVIDGTGDFDGNGTPDVLWRNGVTGDVVIWFMDGPTLVRSVLVARIPITSLWAVKGVGDFDGDGKADICWYRPSTRTIALWLMDGPTITAAQVVATGIDVNWAFGGIGDFDGDGDTDFIWHNSSTNDVALWLTDGSTITQAGVIASALFTVWAIRAIGDINNDGIDDVIWRNLATGDVAAWLLNGLAFPNGAVILAAVPAQWLIQGTGDFDGDGDADLLWRNSSNGNVGVWIMDGHTLVVGVFVLNVPLVDNWSIRGVADLSGPAQAWP